jgi:N6-adenosine-specific RNA methylase IME4
MYPQLTKLELFARSNRPGWASWGNQLPDSDQETVGADASAERAQS